MRLIKQTYTMDMHDAGKSDEWPELSLELMDAGGGEFLVISAAHWAIDTEDEINQLAEAMKAMLSGAKT